MKMCKQTICVLSKKAMWILSSTHIAFSLTFQLFNDCFLLIKAKKNKSLSFISPFRNLSFLYLRRGLLISCKGIGV